MQKPLTTVFQLLAAGMMLLGYAPAQQTPAAPAAQPTAPASASTPAPKAQAPAAKKATTSAKSATTLTLKTQKEKASYALGMKIGGDLRRQSVNTAIDPALTARGLKDALAGSKTMLMTEDEEKAALTQLQTEMRGKMEAKSKEAAAVGHKEGDAFLAANKSKDGVVTLPSGLQYKILTAGTGPKPTASDTVTVNYKGTLIDGSEFDSSYKRGQPATFPVGGVIKGWTEALQLMPVGSKWQLFIPADLAYGDQGRPGIPPGATLVFEVELISIGEAKK
ncbi:MAG TPA: FKBP-type peptidyl-prolyl cis-trans isomerase [Candidatus Sulfotelmatobacter sp.]|jgi:FKBP-type peptidyl-prolyl cis-trans isomerase